jgi:glycosyltransferase involved in cell wall biosynthesis
MKKVAMIGPELCPIPPIRGGATELWIEKAAHALKRYKPFVFSPGDPALPFQETVGKVEYIRIQVSPIKKFLYNMFNAYLSDYENKIARILEGIDPDVIHIHNRPLLIPVFRRSFPKKKIIFHMHNLYNYLGDKERPSGNFEIPTDLTIGCSCFVLDSEKNRMVKGSNRQAVVYNGVDTDTFVPAWLRKAEALEFRRQYGLEGKKVVLFTGKIRESKGVDVVFRAMKEVFRREQQAILVLAGGTGFGYKRADRKTEFYNRLRKEIEPYRERVLLLGFIPPREMHRIYVLGDIFVAPSQLDEGLGMVFLEASSCGLPIISTRQGGIPEAVVDQKTGLLLEEKNNIKELSDKILYLLQHPQYMRELGENGRRFTVEYFSWVRIAQITEGLYDSLFDPIN